MRLLTDVLLTTGVHFEVEWVIFLLLPPMGVFASVFLFATICVGLNEILCLPLGTLIFLILEGVRLSPEILPIMGVDANISGVCGVAVGAPDCFEVEHIEIGISIEFVK